MYDRDFFGSNDAIGESQIDLSQLLEDVALTKAPLTLNKKYYEDVMSKESDVKMNFSKMPASAGGNDSRFWLDMLAKDKKGKITKNGKVWCQCDLMPVSHADKNPVGKARDNPNHSPNLPAPVGRLEFSFNPFKMLLQLVSPAIRRKIYCGLCVAAMCALIVAIFPMIISTIVSNLIMKLLGFK